MRKTVSLFAAIAMALSAFVPTAVFAAADPGLEQAISEARTRIELSEEYTQFDSSVSKDGLLTDYYLRWSTVGDSYETSRTVSIRINSKNDITQYHTGWYDDRDDNLKLAKYTAQQLKDAAAAWIEQVNPSWVPELNIADADVPTDKSVFDTDVSLVFRREVNGVPFCNNYVSLNLNKQSGKVTYMHSNWTYADSVPAADGIIDMGSAQKKFAQYSPMELKYLSSNDDNQYLAYIPARSDVMISAADGSETEYLQGAYGTTNDAEAPAAVAAADIAFSSAGGGSARKEAYQLSAEEQANVDEMSNLISAEDAEKLLKSMPELGIEDYTMAQSYYNRYGDENNRKYRLSIEMRKGSKEDMKNAHATLDAADGTLLDYWQYDEDDYRSSVSDEKKPVIKPEQAQKAARDFAAKYAAEEFAQTKNDKTDSERYGASFVRYANDIKCEANYINVSVSPTSGKIKNYSLSWNKDFVFENPDGIISADTAAQKLFEQVGLELKYIDLNRMMYGERPSKPALVYVLKSDKPNRISAKKGTLLTYSGEEYKPYTPASSELTDIDGHYGAAAIKALLDNGVITLKDGQTEFRPDDFITQEEMLGFVSNLVGEVGIMLRTEIYSIASRNRIVLPDEKNPEAISTREEAAKYIVRALGYDNIATLPNIYDSRFADRSSISEGMEGYVSIAKGFGIVRGDEDNNFNPKDSVTRADAAIMIYNYLNR